MEGCMQIICKFHANNTPLYKSDLSILEFGYPQESQNKYPADMQSPKVSLHKIHINYNGERSMFLEKPDRFQQVTKSTSPVKGSTNAMCLAT